VGGTKRSGFGVRPGQSRLAEAHFLLSAADTGDAAVVRVGYLGVIAARRGDTTRARTVADSLAGQQRKWDLGLSEWWRAAIAGSSGSGTQQCNSFVRRGQRPRDGLLAQPSGARVAARYAPFQEMIRR